MSVDFPAALSPTRPTTSPAPTASETWRSATTAPKRLETFRISTRGGGHGSSSDASVRRTRAHSVTRRLTTVLRSTARSRMRPVATWTQNGLTPRRLRPLRTKLMKSPPATGARDGRGAAEEARSAEHGGRDDLELQHHPGVRRAVSEASGEHDCGEGAEEPDGAVDRELDAVDVDPHRPGRLFPAADGEGVEAESGLGEDHPADDRDDGGEDDRRVQGPDLAASEPEHELVLDRGRVAVAHDERDPAKGGQHGEGHHERRQAELDEVPVDEARDESEHQHRGDDDLGGEPEAEEGDDEHRHEGRRASRRKGRSRPSP